MDYGFEAAGFETRVAVEFDPDCCATLRSNRTWPVIERDIHLISTEEILKTADLNPGDADLLIGGPPCQPFSKAGYWASGDSMRLNDPRAGTLGAYMRVLEEALPKAFVLENVSGLAFSGKDEGLLFLLATIQAINERTGCNYQPFFKVLKAAEFGVPQLRERFFLVAHRQGLKFSFPSPTHMLPSESESLFADSLLEPARTAWDALGDLQDEPPDTHDLAMRGKWADLLPSIPEGQNYLYHTERGGGLPLFGWRRRYWTFLLKLAKDLPSWTLQAQPGPAVGPFHWKNRRLSAREMCRLQTFPDDVQLVGTLAAVQKQVGNAVPSLLAEVVGRSIRQQWMKEEQFALTPRLLQPRRSPIPVCEKLQPVPLKYRQLMHLETAHPGTGKGYGALARMATVTA
jgi:DNA (cytosine-5)-methyltransferase 1